MTEYLTKYGYAPDQEAMGRALEMIASNLDKLASEQVYKDCFSMMDLTTLKTDDTPASVTKLVNKVNAFRESYPEWPLPASVCVYPNFAATVKEARACDFNITVVSACFPSSQSFLEVKVRECELAVEQGADEVDIVLALNAFLAGDYETAAEEIRQVRAAIDAVAEKQGRKVHLKVILETGLLRTPERIAVAGENGTEDYEVYSADAKLSAEIVKGIPHVKAEISIKGNGNGEAAARLIKVCCQAAIEETLKEMKADVIGLDACLAQDCPEYYAQQDFETAKWAAEFECVVEMK